MLNRDCTFNRNLRVPYFEKKTAYLSTLVYLIIVQDVINVQVGKNV